MKKLFVVEVVGAPSPTAVIVIDEDINLINWKRIAYDVYYFLKSKNVTFSKMAIIKLREKSAYDFKFIQIKKKNDTVELESNVNCGNSMVASARAIYKLQEEQQEFKNGISITNIDTQLEIYVEKKENTFKLFFKSLIGKNINNAKMFKNSEAITMQEDFGNIKVSIIDIVAPYIITNARDFGISSNEELLELNESNKDIFERVKRVREDVVRKYNFNENSEFPKIAVVFSNNETLSARTIYLDGWHKGLPITGAVSIKLASKMKGSVIYKEKSCNNEILTPKGSKVVNIKIDEEGTILDCSVSNIKSSGNINIYDYKE